MSKPFSHDTLGNWPTEKTTKPPKDPAHRLLTVLVHRKTAQHQQTTAAQNLIRDPAHETLQHRVGKVTASYLLQGKPLAETKRLIDGGKLLTTETSTNVLLAPKVSPRPNRLPFNASNLAHSTPQGSTAPNYLSPGSVP